MASSPWATKAAGTARAGRNLVARAWYTKINPEMNITGIPQKMAPVIEFFFPV